MKDELSEFKIDKVIEKNVLLRDHSIDPALRLLLKDFSSCMLQLNVSAFLRLNPIQNNF